MNNIRVIVLGTALAAIASSASAVNILVNPGFEAGNLSGWTTNGQVATNTDSHTGSWSSWSNGNFFVQQSFAAVSNALINEVSVWSKQPNVGANYFFAFTLFYSDASSEQLIGNSANSGGWAKHDFTAQLDAGKSLVGINAYGYTSGQPNLDITMHDDFVVDVVPEPATGVVLLAGAALAAFRRRRRSVA